MKRRRSGAEKSYLMLTVTLPPLAPSLVKSLDKIRFHTKGPHHVDRRNRSDRKRRPPPRCRTCRRRSSSTGCHPHSGGGSIRLLRGGDRLGRPRTPGGLGGVFC